ncbi:MAG: CAAX prenyl protease-related protein, partial [Verrucomicrobia bacterium]|nr:CAAX prenyl protease-related protein [Verrucomicrobiota bacterium]
PWRWYPRFIPVHTFPAVGVGVVVFLVWIAGETELASRWEHFQAIYLRVGLMPPWRLPDPVGPSVFAPEMCGWGLTITRLLGSALVIAVIEEFFWRGFVYRMLIDRDFVRVPLDRLVLGLFLVTAVAFGLEHQRWLVGIMAGCAYGWLMLRTRDIWAAVLAHVTTNLLLGIYVIAVGNYVFW